MGFGDLGKAMNEIRRLTLPYWDMKECEMLQKKQEVKHD